MNIIFSLICIFIILIYFFVGMSNVKHLEKVCTEKIIVNNIDLKKYNSFGLIYFSATCSFTYNSKEYTVTKGLFGKQYENIKELTININPNNPNECYFIDIKHRCFVN